MNRTLRFLSLASTVVSFFCISSVSAQQVALQHRFTPNPLILEGISGGELEASEVVKTKETSTGYCYGYVNAQPNHILVLENFFDFLKIEVESNHDTTIVIEGPGGVWCNDDSYTTNPVIEGEWQEGSYKIWIGSYQENSSNSYQIKITE